jgi:hypothetical protein
VAAVAPHEPSSEEASHGSADGPSASRRTGGQKPSSVSTLIGDEKGAIRSTNVDFLADSTFSATS